MGIAHLPKGVWDHEGSSDGRFKSYDHYPVCGNQREWDKATNSKGKRLESIKYNHTNAKFLIHHFVFVDNGSTMSSSAGGTVASFCPHCGLDLRTIIDGDLVEDYDPFEESFSDAMGGI